MQTTVLIDVLILLTVSIVTVTLFRRLGLPAILGYLSTGLIAGPHGFGWLAFDDLTRFLGELGIVFLLFSIGLEFSLPLLLNLRRYLLGIGSVQVAGGTLAGFVIAQSFGLDWRGSLVLGAATALSSTAIVLTQLAEQHELQERHGRLALGILLFQDLAAVPFLVVIPLLASHETALLGPLSTALLKGGLAFIAIWIIGRRLMPRLLYNVTRAASPELFTLTVLFLALATATFTGMVGLSMAMGAFLAGMLLGETVYRHQIEADARPFKDVLMGLFFVTVGMELDYRLLPEMWPQTLVLLLGITFGKGSLIAALVWSARQGLATATRTGLLLGHGGEFGIALLALALTQGVLSHEAAQPVLTAMVVSMMIAPLLVRHNGALARLLTAPLTTTRRGSESGDTQAVQPGLSDHVIIAGFGRLGQNLATFLRQLGVPYLALDLDGEVVHQARLAGETVYYGDCTRRSILAQAGLARARVLVVTINGAPLIEKVIAASRAVSPETEILVRTRDDRHMETLLGKGATEVLPETLEASLALASHLLERLDYAEADIQPLLDSIRRNGYRELRATFSGAHERGRARRRSYLQTVRIAERAAVVGRQLWELGFDELGVQVVAIRRSGIRGDQPLRETRLMAGDALVLEGESDALHNARQRLEGG